MVTIVVQPIDITQIIVAVITAAGGIVATIIVQSINRRQRQRNVVVATGSRRIKIFIIIILISSILLIGNFLFFLARPKTEVEITYPHNDNTVEIREMVRGTSQNIPEGQVIYIIVYPHIAGRYYPQDNPVDIQVNGEWITPAFIGIEEDTGEKFDIIAVIADEMAQDAFNVYFTQPTWGGFENLPKGALIYCRVTVTRK